MPTAKKLAPRALSIITGRGLHSEHGVAVVKPAVIELLAAPAYAALQASEAPGNPGELLISAARLKAWCKHAQKKKPGHASDHIIDW